MERHLRILLFLPLAWLGPAEPVCAQQGLYAVEQVKAAFLYHFGTYVDWPDSIGSDAITIAVLGDDGVADELRRFLPGRTIDGRPARMRVLRSIEDLGNDQVLFVGAEEGGRLRELITAVDGRPVLVVTDVPDGLEAGAIVNFRLVERRLRFEISVPAARAAGLMLSSRLLSAAVRVETAHRLDAPYPHADPWLRRWADRRGPSSIRPVRYETAARARHAPAAGRV